MMETKDDQPAWTGILRGTIAILTRGGPGTVHGQQSTNPVLLQGMPLPAEAGYSFVNPTDELHPANNSPVSIELFFGENGITGLDISLGKFQLKDLLPAFAGSKKIELSLAVSPVQVLSISLFDHATQKYRSIGFIDLSSLEPPEIKPLQKIEKMTDYFNQISRQINDLTSNLKPRQVGLPHRGKDITQELTISFREALLGGLKQIEAAGTQACPACNGSGIAAGRTLVGCLECDGTGWKKEESQTAEGPQVRLTNCSNCKGDGLINAYPCRNCRGNGWVRITRPLVLQIPACLDAGAVICVLYKGEPGRNGGLPGHLQIAVEVAAHPFLERTGRDITMFLPVSAGFARQGGHLRVPGLEKGSSFLINLPPGTKSEAQIRVTENETYTLSAIMEVYRPAFLFSMPDTGKHLQAIKKLLGDEDYELPGWFAEDGHVPGEKSSVEAVKAPAVSMPAGQSVQQAEFYLRRGMLYTGKGNKERALADFDKALELDPQLARAYDNRSAVYVGKKDPVKALADLEKAIALNPDNALFIYHRGLFFDLQKDPRKALADYNKALELDPTNAEAYESRGRLVALQKDLQAAIADFSRVLELNPTTAKIYHQRAILYQGLKDMAKSLADFDKALELDPDNDSIFGDRIFMFIAQNNLERALADTDKLLERHPKNARAYNNRGYIYWLQNKLDKALSDYNKALELDPKLVPAYNYRGQTYLKQLHYKQAVEDFNKSLLLHPGDPYLDLWLGQAYQGLGHKARAIESYHKVLAASQNPELRQEAQNLLAGLGVKQAP